MPTRNGSIHNSLSPIPPGTFGNQGWVDLELFASLKDLQIKFWNNNKKNLDRTLRNLARINFELEPRLGPNFIANTAPLTILKYFAFEASERKKGFSKT